MHLLKYEAAADRLHATTLICTGLIASRPQGIGRACAVRFAKDGADTRDHVVAFFTFLDVIRPKDQ
jgi:hypothetical protein